jgi:RimJ/RimL family protein N-acetyltransferase
VTARISIVPTTIALLDAEEEGGSEALSVALRVVPPPVWPAEFNDISYRQWQRALLNRWPDEPEYAGFYLVGDGELVGTCGFKGPPTASGVVEIGYSVVAPRRRRGYASGGVSLLLSRAFADPRVARIVAEILAGDAASQGVLLRCGFRQFGTRVDADDGEIVCFERTRE